MKIAVLLALSVTLASAQPVSPTEIKTTAEKAYNFAYPLVLMEHTRKSFLEVDTENQLTNIPEFPDFKYHRVVRPNADTLYTIAWIDLSRQPVVLHLPDTKGRYYLMQFLDAWTETFSIPGKRTTGTDEKWMAITGPNWHGSLPAHTQKIESPTNIVWLIGRTQTNGTQDYAAVHEVQKGYMLMPLDRYPDGAKKPEKSAPKKKYDPAAITPPVQVLRMTPANFFNEFALLLEKNPPHQEDGPMMRDLARIGIRPGKPFDSQSLGAAGQAALEAGAHAASAKLEAAVDPPSHKTSTGWAGFGAKVGRYGTDYGARAIVARVGLGANAPEDAVYLNCTLDGSGKPLDGKRQYRMHFAKDGMPPVHAFWSVTMYDQAGYFVENPIQRYAIGDRDALKFNADGSLDLFISRQAPAGKQSNWLPAAAGSFNLTFRLYWPKDPVLQGKWIPPAVQSEP